MNGFNLPVNIWAYIFTFTEMEDMKNIRMSYTLWKEATYHLVYTKWYGLEKIKQTIWYSSLCINKHEFDKLFTSKIYTHEGDNYINTWCFGEKYLDDKINLVFVKDHKIFCLNNQEQDNIYSIYLDKIFDYGFYKVFYEEKCETNTLYLTQLKFNLNINAMHFINGLNSTKDIDSYIYSNSKRMFDGYWHCQEKQIIIKANPICNLHPNDISATIFDSISGQPINKKLKYTILLDEK